MSFFFLIIFYFFSYFFNFVDVVEEPFSAGRLGPYGLEMKGSDHWDHLNVEFLSLLVLPDLHCQYQSYSHLFASTHIWQRDDLIVSSPWFVNSVVFLLSN